MKGDAKSNTLIYIIIAIAIIVIVSMFVFPPIFQVIFGSNNMIKLGQRCVEWSMNDYEGTTVETKDQVTVDLEPLCRDALRLDHPTLTTQEWNDCRAWCNKTMTR